MSKSNNKKDPIEELFQQKAEDYEIPYNESDWRKLEERLDKMDQQRTHRKRLRWAAAASILIFSLLGYFTYENYIKINQISQQLSEETTSGLQQGTPDEDIQNGNEGQSSAEEELNGVVAADDSTKENKNTPLLSSDDNLVRQQTGSESGREVEERARQGDRASEVLSGSGSSEIELFVSELPCPACMLSVLTAEKYPLAYSDVDVRASRVETGDTGLAADPDNNVSGLIGSGDKIPGHASRAAISLVTGPDLSTVGSISNFYDPGYKLGVAVEFRLSRNLSISTGVIQAEVRYRAQGSEYKPPEGYWTYGVIPKETVGECILLDIPISLKYSFIQFNSSRLYATAGLSSYIMLNEDYRFNYDRENNSRLVQGWSGKTGTRHWMSNAGFSIGYELDVHANWSLRAEPFVKIPLEEVGWGNVKLYSLGSFISINYKL